MKVTCLVLLTAAILNHSIPAAPIPSTTQDFVLVEKDKAATILLDSSDYPVVKVAADCLANDIQRITGRRPAITSKPFGSAPIVIAGTLGHSAWIDKLVSGGKLKKIDEVKGRWEATLTQLVENPFPGIDRALVIAGSDRRGTAYGLTQLSESIGVSPWYWWADVPVPHRDDVTTEVSGPQVSAPGVKYRGIFINDEDWGLNPWAAKTFDPDFKNIGPKTYEKVFELMLRLRLNYIWPAMHGCTAEFGSVPENVALADKFGIVAGSSHCEPMLCNNIRWNQKEKGPWNYSTNRETIHSYWEENVKARSTEEAVWTLGIRGIHDAGMQTPPSDTSGKLNLLTEIFRDQRALLNQYVTKQWGPIAQCFVPYKEVLPVYDAGLKVPDDVTLVWVDDNFGYIRRLSAPEERTRPGGSGVYWHISYFGSPHSYTWLNTTAPALMWEELHKAWENDSRTLWVINVGDIKPMETTLDYFSRLAWNPDGFSLGGQQTFLREFAGRNIGKELAEPIGTFLMEYFRLGTIRKPELMDREWALSLRPEQATELENDYRDLLKRERDLSGMIPENARDSYIELVGFPARVLASTGLIFMADRKAQSGEDASKFADEIAHLRKDLEAEVDAYNTKLAGGKWNGIMPGLVTGKELMKWSSQVRWPWGETEPAKASSNSNNEPPDGQVWRDAATAIRQTSGAARWVAIEGLGHTGRAMALEPASLESAWKEGDGSAPALEYDFTSKGGDADAYIDFLPTFRIYPGMKLRVSVRVDGHAPTTIEVPGSSGAQTETGTIRSFAVQSNYTRARVPLTGLAAGKHVFTIHAIDPGAVIDRVSLP